MTINKYRRSGKNRKSPLGKRYSNDGYRQEPLMDIKISGWKDDEKQRNYIVSKCFPRRYLLITEGETVTLQWRSLVDPPKAIWILVQKKDINGKTGKIQIRPVD